MNKTDLINQISEKADLTKAAAGRALDAVLELITSSLQDGVPVMLAGFGAFLVRHRAARDGRNPSTGEKIKIKATKTVGFKAAKALKEAVLKEKETA
jgi:DNA-binding protein HU-beta